MFLGSDLTEGFEMNDEQKVSPEVAGEGQDIDRCARETCRGKSYHHVNGTGECLSIDCDCSAFVSPGKVSAGEGVPERIWIPISAAMLMEVSPELQNVEGEWYVREPARVSPVTVDEMALRIAQKVVFFKSGGDPAQDVLPLADIIATEMNSGSVVTPVDVQEDKNSGEPKPKAPCYSSVVIPKDNQLDADRTQSKAWDAIAAAFRQGRETERARIQAAVENLQRGYDEPFHVGYNHAIDDTLVAVDNYSPSQSSEASSTTTVTDKGSVQHETESSEPASSSQAVIEIRERRSKITDAPWIRSALAGMYVVAEGKDYETVCAVGEYNTDGSIHLVFDNAPDNLQFIANAPTDIDTLLSIIDSLQAALNSSVANERKLAARIVLDDLKGK